MRAAGPSLLQVAGMSAITVGFFILAAWLGWVVGGALLLALGWLTEKR